LKPTIEQATNTNAVQASIDPKSVLVDAVVVDDLTVVTGKVWFAVDVVVGVDVMLD
jgi:hypothetical protein